MRSDSRSRRLLVIEDDHTTAELIRHQLAEKDLETVHCTHGKAGIERALNESFDLFIVDIRLPDISGEEVCRLLRRAGLTKPIVVLSGEVEEQKIISTLEAGADDYIRKPCTMLELSARISATLRLHHRQDRDTQGPMPTPPRLDIDPITRAVTCDGNQVELRRREFDLLLFLSGKPGRVFTRSQLLDNVWQDQGDRFEHTVSATINRLRKKLETAIGGSSPISTVWGVGYRYDDTRDDAVVKKTYRSGSLCDR